ncbi:MAG: hypothetical protein KF882_01930 [Bacteroidia bacterium]|nr:hypothetical protein [Bacteroidia bacterium]MCO5254005.1 hypothetical protein [Bacteroidota bacterium]
MVKFIKSTDGNFCTLDSLGNTPTLFFAPFINAPQSGYSSTVIPSGKEVIFIGENGVALNPGFEVELGATFSAF